MDVKEATHIARDYITDVFADEEITQLGLEEVVQDQDTKEWRITIGFVRPWDKQGALGLRMGLKAPRDYAGLQGSRHCRRRREGYLAHRPADAGASAMLMAPEGFFQDANLLLGSYDREGSDDCVRRGSFWNGIMGKFCVVGIGGTGFYGWADGACDPRPNGINWIWIDQGILPTCP